MFHLASSYGVRYLIASQGFNMHGPHSGSPALNPMRGMPNRDAVPQLGLHSEKYETNLNLTGTVSRVGTADLVTHE